MNGQRANILSSKGTSHLQNLISGRVRQVQRIGDGTTGNLTIMHIKP
jgi:hypothetical protein